MKTCSKCGAENKPTAELCRLCGTPLLVSSANIATSPSHQATSNAAAAPPGEVACPNCKTVNEADWSFCQQCGAKLSRAPANQVVTAGALPHQRDEPEVKAPPAMPQSVDRALTTVPSETTQPPLQSAADLPEEEFPKVTPPAPQAFRTVVDQAAIIPPNAPPIAPQITPQITPPIAASSLDATELVHSEPLPSLAEGGIACPQCGKLNTADSAFCASCGASVLVAQTVVMSSAKAIPKGRLHLIMEGGQSGEVYELKDETTVGRTTGDITFPHDGFMSGRHARVIRRGASFVLVDQDSRNGTFIKIKSEVELKPGDMVLIGRQLFRFEV